MPHRLTISIVSLLVFGLATSASACGPSTLDLVKGLATMEKAPLFRCGEEFNDMLAFAHKREWKAALQAYEAHLAGLGKWEAGSENAKATLAYLRQKSSTK